MQADTELEAMSHSQRRRSSLKKSNLLVFLVPTIDYKNLALILLFYVVFYSFLCGFYLLLLQGVTSAVGGQQNFCGHSSTSELPSLSLFR